RSPALLVLLSFPPRRSSDLDVLRVAHLTGGVFLHAEFFAPWCIATRLSPEHCAPLLGSASHLIVYHYVVEGDLRIRIDGEEGDRSEEHTSELQSPDHLVCLL